MSGFAYENTRWQPNGPARSWCTDCGLRQQGKQGTVVTAARRHVEATGHRVQLYRSQWRATFSPESESGEARP